MEHRTDNPCDRMGSVLGPKRDIVRRMRALPHREVAAALEKFRASRSTHAVKLAFEPLGVTAARSGEARTARWEEIDLASRVWTIPSTALRPPCRTCHDRLLSVQNSTERRLRGHMSQTTAKQHYVPRLLLRHWAQRTKLGEGTLQVVPIDTRQAGLIFAEETSIDSFAQDSNLFSEATEETFMDLEQKAGIAIQQLTKFVASQDRASIDTNRITSGLRGLVASVLLRSARRREADTHVRELAHHVTDHAKEIKQIGMAAIDGKSQVKGYRKHRLRQNTQEVKDELELTESWLVRLTPCILVGSGDGFVLSDAAALVCNKWFQATDYRHYQQLYTRGTVVILPLTPKLAIVFADPEMYTIRCEVNKYDIRLRDSVLDNTLILLHLSQDSTQELNVLQAIYAEEGVVLHKQAHLKELESARAQIEEAREMRPYIEVFAKHIATFDRGTRRGRSEGMFWGSVPNAPWEARLSGRWIRVADQWEHIGIAERDKSVPKISTAARWNARQLEAIRMGMKAEEELAALRLNTNRNRILRQDEVTRVGKDGLAIRPDLSIDSKWKRVRRESRKGRRKRVH